MRIVCPYMAPLVSVITTLYYVAKIIFHRQVWYSALSLRCACIRSSDIILIPQPTFVPNFVSFTPSIAELAHGEKSRIDLLCHSVNHPAYLMPGNRSLRFEVYIEVQHNATGIPVLTTNLISHSRKL